MLKVSLKSYKAPLAKRDKFRLFFFWCFSYTHISLRLECNHEVTYLHFTPAPGEVIKTRWLTEEQESRLYSRYKTIQVPVGEVDYPISNIKAYSDTASTQMKPWIYLIIPFLGFLPPNDLWIFGPNVTCTEHIRNLLNQIFKTSFKSRTYPNSLLQEVVNETKNLYSRSDDRLRKQ